MKEPGPGTPALSSGAPPVGPAAAMEDPLEHRRLGRAMRKGDPEGRGCVRKGEEATAAARGLCAPLTLCYGSELSFSFQAPRCTPRDPRLRRSPPGGTPRGAGAGSAQVDLAFTEGTGSGSGIEFLAPSGARWQTRSTGALPRPQAWTEGRGGRSTV